MPAHGAATPATVPKPPAARLQATDPRRTPSARAGTVHSRLLTRALPSAGEDKPGPAVDELTYGIEVTGMTCRLGYDVQHDLAEIVQPPAAEELRRPPGRRGFEGSGGDNRVGELNLLPVLVEDGLGWQVRVDLPGIAGGIDGVTGLTGDDAAEPETLDVQGEMLHEPQACPLRRKHGPPQVVLGQAVEDTEHVIALIIER